MAKQLTYRVDIKIDKLTNSIVNTISGDSFDTDVLAVSKNNLKVINKKKITNSTQPSKSYS
ncbi:MAG: hypothetical protein QM541_09740 [Flavobacterium sp.]|nr:hypothetical protein [Flavobacterium sp.]